MQIIGGGQLHQNQPPAENKPASAVKRKQLLWQKLKKWEKISWDSPPEGVNKRPSYPAYIALEDLMP